MSICVSITQKPSVKRNLMLLRKLVLLLCLCRTFRISNHCYLRHAHKIHLSSFQDTNDVSGELKWTRKSDLYAYNCCPRAVIKEMIISCCSLVWVFVLYFANWISKWRKPRNLYRSASNSDLKDRTRTFVTWGLKLHAEDEEFGTCESLC